MCIIASHYSLHGGYPEFDVNNISNSVIFIQELSMFGKTACSVFAIITGYYLFGCEYVNYKKVFGMIMMMIGLQKTLLIQIMLLIQYRSVY